MALLSVAFYILKYGRRYILINVFALIKENLNRMLLKKNNERLYIKYKQLMSIDIKQK